MELFAGTSSSQAAKEAYVPIREMIKTERLLLGSNTSAILMSDPKLLLFTLAKYKFAGKMLSGKNVIELGCMDGTGSILLSSFVNKLVSIDFYLPHIEDCKSIQKQGYLKNVEFYHRNILDQNKDLHGKHSGAVCFDVLEHLDPNSSDLFFQRSSSYLCDEGLFICGIPSIQSQKYASEVNRKSHINCMEFDKLINFAQKYYLNVMPFSLNDEIVHTGYWNMSQYNIVVCSNKIV